PSRPRCCWGRSSSPPRSPDSPDRLRVATTPPRRGRGATSSTGRGAHDPIRGGGASRRATAGGTTSGSRTGGGANVSLDGRGHLAIPARRERYTGPDGRTARYTSGRINTRRRFEFAYGR